MTSPGSAFPAYDSRSRSRELGDGMAEREYRDRQRRENGHRTPPAPEARAS